MRQPGLKDYHLIAGRFVATVAKRKRSQTCLVRHGNKLGTCQLGKGSRINRFLFAAG